MSTNKGQESRKHIRFDVNWTVELSANDWKDVKQLTTYNVSRGGLFICSERPLDLGTSITIVIRLPDQNLLTVEGLVVHAIDSKRAQEQGLAPGFGIKFSEKYSVELGVLEAMAASNLGGTANTYDVNQLFITLPAVLRGLEEEQGEATTAHHLIEQSAEPAPTHKPAQPSAPSQAATQAQAAAPSAAPQKFSVDNDAIFGIDFGTSYTSIGVVSGGQLKVLENEEGQVLMPSVVCYPENEPVAVGWPAREKMVMNPATTIASVKRLLGRSYDDPQVSPYLGQMAMRTSKGPGGMIVADIYGQQTAMPQIASEIFKQIARIGERATGIPVKRVVLSGPVGYVDERKAIKRAAELAGLQIMAMLDEPVAAALAYGVGRGADQIVAIYDFGGGTFDFTLLKVANNRFKVMGEAGDSFLGGDDFDRVLAEYAANDFWQQTKVELRNRQVEYQRLLFMCEGAKRKLSTQQEVELLARSMVISLKGPIDLRMTLTREKFVELCGELIDRSIQAMQQCFEQTKISPSDVNKVVLTGGVSRIPLVREKVQEYFQQEIQLSVNPEQAIVMGNAIYGRHIALSQRKQSV